VSAPAAFLPGGAREPATRLDPWSVDAWEFETDLYTEQVVRWSTLRRLGGEIDVRASGTDEGAVTAAFAAACAQAADRAKDPGKYGDSDER
jgi:integrase